MWTSRLENLPGNCRECGSIGGKIYMIPLYPPGNTIGVYVFDTACYRWDLVETQLLPDGRPKKYDGHTIVTYGGCAYIWGGMNSRPEPDDAVYCMDTNTMTWSRPQVSGEVPSNATYHSACMVDQRMYVFGGWTIDSPRHVRFLDLAAMKWHLVTTSGEAPTRRKCHTAVSIGGRMYVWGGIEDNTFEPDTYDNSIYYLDTTTSTWVRPHVEGALPEGRSSHAAFVYKGDMYIFGGYNGTYFTDIHKYDPVNSRWTEVAQKRSGPRTSSLASCCVIGDRVFVINARHPIRPGDNQQVLESSFQGEVPPDLHVFDFAPTLKTLCLLAFLDARLDVSLLPPVNRNEICAMTANESAFSPS